MSEDISKSDKDQLHSKPDTGHSTNKKESKKNENNLEQTTTDSKNENTKNQNAKWERMNRKVAQMLG